MAVGDDVQLSMQDILTMLGYANANLELATRRNQIKDARIAELEAEIESLSGSSKKPSAK